MSERITLEGLSVTAHGVMLPIGLKLDDAEVRGKGAAVTTKPFAISLDEPGTIVVRISSASVKAFLERKAPKGVGSFDVAFEDGFVKVASTVRVLLLELRGTATCILRIEGGKRLWVDLENLDVSAEAARTLVESQVERINPVFDASELPIDVELQNLEVTDDFIVLTGQVSPPSADQPDA